MARSSPRLCSIVRAACSIEHGLWYARSAEFLQQPLLETLRWLRLVGDTVFLAGVAALVAVLAVALVLAPGRYRPGLALILGGAAGNLVDRLRFDGAVLDFFDTPWWPAFNLADAFIVAGVGVVLLAAFRGARA